MNLLRRIFAFFALFRASPASHAQTAASIGPELRQTFLNITAAKAGVVPNPQFPHVFGVALDWPIDEYFATVISLSDGSASLYTTSTFGVIGGAGHEVIRAAAKHFVSTAEKYFAEASPVSAYPYPPRGKVRFYLLTYSGVRVIEADAERIYSGSDKFSPLFGAAQDVVTQLRLVTEKK
jgi:hypothetical protein